MILMLVALGERLRNFPWASGPNSDSCHGETVRNSQWVSKALARLSTGVHTDH